MVLFQEEEWMETKKFMKSVRKYSDDWYQLQELEKRSRQPSKQTSRSVSWEQWTLCFVAESLSYFVLAVFATLNTQCCLTEWKTWPCCDILQFTQVLPYFTNSFLLVLRADECNHCLTNSILINVIIASPTQCFSYLWLHVFTTSRIQCSLTWHWEAQLEISPRYLQIPVSSPVIFDNFPTRN